MAREIERKFLVNGDKWRQSIHRRSAIRQAYLAVADGVTIRVRIIDDERAFISVKTARQGPSRGEYEYPVPVEDAHEMLPLRTGIILEKHRHLIAAPDAVWEVDEFQGVHKGLVLAEIELAHACARFAMPEWLGAEVTSDPRYSNGYLATHAPAAHRLGEHSAHRAKTRLDSNAAA